MNTGATHFEMYKQRRDRLRASIAKRSAGKQGPIVLFGAFESERYKFRQDSSFYYFTGLQEPATVLVIEPDNTTVLYVPHFGDTRTKWVLSEVYGANKEQLKKWGIDRIDYLGDQCKGYSFSCMFSDAEYRNLVDRLKKYVVEGQTIFTLYPISGYNQQCLVLTKLTMLVPGLEQHMSNIAPEIASLRRTKSAAELEYIHKAVDCTAVAQETAARIIDDRVGEFQVQAGLEFIFTESCGKPAFPSIVASGSNSTVLHYNNNNRTMKNGELVVVDIGVELDYYCADLTRTYPVAGSFTKRQKEVYMIVLETQEYIAQVAKAGYWISNKQYPDKSLHHLALMFLEKAGYAQYFTHGIGHFLGMDVHDVGNMDEPLKAGDVITIEPGIYIPQEKMGIRIEDNYWITDKQALCLSEELPKEPAAIEDLMAGALDDFSEFEDDDYADED